MQVAEDTARCDLVLNEPEGTTAKEGRAERVFGTAADDHLDAFSFWRLVQR